MKKYEHYIVYCTTCQVTKKWYIGVHSTNNLDDGYLGSGKLLKYSIDKYGKENHTRKILFHCDTEEQAYEIESSMVNHHTIKLELCMNLVEGGVGGNKIDYSDPENNWIREKSSKRRSILNRTDENLKSSNSKRMKINNPMQKAQSRKKATDALDKYRNENDHPRLGTSHSEITKQKIRQTRKKRNIQPWNKGIKQEKTEYCIACGKYFTEQGIKRHKKVCL